MQLVFFPKYYNRSNICKIAINQEKNQSYDYSSEVMSVIAKNIHILRYCSRFML